MMPAILNYLIKVSASLILLYFFYCIVLRRMTCYNWNRSFLLGYSLLSFFIPFIDISSWTGLPDHHSIRFVYLPSLPASIHQEVSGSTHSFINYQSILLYILLAGGLVMLIRLFVQLISLYRLKSKATLLSNTPVKIYHLDDDILPFSFHRSIFINRHQQGEEAFQEIVNHELVHIKQNHTIDVLITEIICIVNWYNPFAWFIKRAIKENLEFIADEQVVRSGADKKQYQYHLLRVMGYASSAIVSHFNFPALKKRIVMMNKPQTGKIHLLKFLFIIPVVLLSLLAFRSTNEHKNIAAEAVNNNASSEEGFHLNNLTYYIKNHEVASLIQSAQNESLLKPGKLLSLSLLQNESNRLKDLLRAHGYSPVTDQTVTFLMDSSLTNKSFSIKVLVNIPERTSAVKEAKGMDQSPDPDALLHQSFQENTVTINAGGSSGTETKGNNITGDIRNGSTLPDHGNSNLNYVKN